MTAPLPASSIDTPAPVFAEITLPAPCAVPPIVMPSAPTAEMPSPLLASGLVPVWSTPM